MRNVTTGEFRKHVGPCVSDAMRAADGLVEKRAASMLAELGDRELDNDLALELIEEVLKR